MAQQLIPLDNNPNQTWQVSLSINNVVVTLTVVVSYNEVSQYWAVSIYDVNGNLLISSLPLFTGLNLLEQFGYLNIGSMYVLNASGVIVPNFPSDLDLGTDYQLVWADNA